MKIYVKAFMDQNFGDDFMILRLLEEFPQISFYIYCPVNLQQFYKKMFCTVSNYEFTEIELRKINSEYPKGYFNFVVLIGGSVLQGSRNKGCYYRLRNIISLKYASLFKTKYLIIGCNTGPFINKLTEYFVKLELRQAFGVSTRDKVSFEFIKQATPKNKNVACSSDLLSDFGKVYNILPNVEEGRLGISVLSSNEKNNLFFANIIDDYIYLTGGNVVLFAFDTGKQNDLAVIKSICDSVKNRENVSVVAHQSENYFDLPHEMAKCERIIGTRFHSIVCATSIGIPVLPIAYSNKTINLLEDLEYKYTPFQLSDIHNNNVRSFVKEVVLNDELFIAPYSFRKSNTHFEFVKKITEEI